MSDLFDAASFPATSHGKLIRALPVQRAREISRLEEDRAAFFVTRPLRAALINLIPLARLAMAQEPNPEVRAAQLRVIEEADEALRSLQQLAASPTGRGCA